MRRIRLLVVATIMCLLGSVVMWVSPASAAPNLTVTPNTNLVDSQLVTVDGSGFPDSVDVVVVECATDTVPLFPSNCQGFETNVTTSSTGTFSTPFVPFIAFGRNPETNCELQSCFIGAAVLTDADNTATFAPITFIPGLADGRIKRRSDGQISGDNVYSPSAPGQRRNHAIEPDGYWTYALQVQNDGPNTDDITVYTTNNAKPQFFFGYYDITSQVTAPGGLVFPAMAPGEVRTFAMRFHAPANAAPDTRLTDSVNFLSANSGAADQLILSVQTPSA